MVAAVDIWLAQRLGIRFEIGSHDVTLWVWLYLALSFALVGYLIAFLQEARRAAQAAQARVEEQIADLKELRSELRRQERLALLGQLAASISHELRNPLAILRTTVQNLEESLSEGDAKESCRFMIEEIDRLTHVTASLLGLTRSPTLRRRAIAIDRLLDRLELLAPRELQEKRIDVERRLEPGLPSVEVDEDLACQVFLDLLTNAAQASPAGSRVEIDVRKSIGGVDVAIADSGPGVAADARDRIFEPFYTTREDGAGLGLPLARQLAESLGASLSLDSAPPREARPTGARFVVTLPCATSAVAQEPTGPPRDGRSIPPSSSAT